MDINLQYISDGKGKTTGVFIPISDWKKLKRRYKGIEDTATEVPDWQKDLVRDRIKNSKEEDLLDWDQVKDDFDGI